MQAGPTDPHNTQPLLVAIAFLFLDVHVRPAEKRAEGVVDNPNDFRMACRCDAWLVLKPDDPGYTYDAQRNRMCPRNRYRSRLDRCARSCLHLVVPPAHHSHEGVCSWCTAGMHR